MGAYTTFQKFYKPAEGDLVDVENDIKYNWERIDARVKQIFEWTVTDESNIQGVLPQENNFKYYKTETAAKFISWANPGTGVQQLYQDAGIPIPPWTLVTPAAGWENIQPQARLAVSILPYEEIVCWRGVIHLASFAELPIKTLTTLATGFPASFRPTANREVQVMGGTTAVGNVSSMMLRFTTTGDIQMVKYGTAQEIGRAHV